MVFSAHERGNQRQFQRLTAADLEAYTKSFLPCTIPKWNVFSRESVAAGLHNPSENLKIEHPPNAPKKRKPLGLHI